MTIEDKLIQAINEGLPEIEGAHFVCLVNNTYYYSNDKYYTLQEVQDYHAQMQAKEIAELRNWELAMEIDLANNWEDYLCDIRRLSK